MKHEALPHASGCRMRGGNIRAARSVLVTGGAGFLGSHLCDHHIARGDRVICLDNLETGRRANVAHLEADPRFSFVLHDVVNRLFLDEKVDLIYNMACPASPPKYQRDPIHTFKTSVFGVANLLDLARLHGARLLQASTSEIYGDPGVSPQRESYWGNVNSFGPRSCYDEGKRGAETLMHDYNARHGVDTRIARIFNTYGPRMDPADGRVVSNFVIQALRGEELTIYGEGRQTRSFCYVDDLVRGLVALMEAPDAPAVRAPVNLGNPDEFTILELAGEVRSLTGSRSTLRFCSLPVDDPRQRRPDIGRAREMLGWAPEVPLREGLARIIPYFRAELDRAGKEAGRIGGAELVA